MKAFKKQAFVIIGALLSLTLLSCSGGGGGGGNSSPTVISGRVVDGYVAGATVTAYQVNANGTQGTQIGSPVTTDTFGNYTIDLGSYSGPVYLTSQGGTYIDSATLQPIDLTNSPLILSAIVSNASGNNFTAQINPLTTMAADVALTLVGQGTTVANAADQANTLIQNYFALTTSPILNTELVDLTTSGCMTGPTGTYTQQSADESLILAGISQLANNNGVGTPDLIEALVQDVTSDGQFDGLASKTIISVPTGTGTIPLSQIEGPALTNLASAIDQFMASTSNVCGAIVDPSVTSALLDTSIFPTPPPAAPTGVLATGGYGSAQIKWDDVTGATSYNVYVATSTGVTGTSVQLPGFRSIQHVTSPADISTGPTNTYYFVVTAATGTSPYEIESAPSAEVSAFVTSTALPALWAQTVSAGSSVSDFEGVSVAADGLSVYAAGDIYGTGTGVATYDFGNNVISSVTNTSTVLVKYTSSGMAQWAQTVAGSNQSAFSSVSVASDGLSVYAAGYIYGTGTYDFGNNVTAAATYTGSNTVLVKYNSSGMAQWARTVAGSNISSFSTVSVASDGLSVYAAGYIYGTGTYDFGNNVTAAGPTNGPNLVLVKYNSSGLAQWARTVMGNNESSFNGVSVASDGLSVYAAGYIAGTGTYDFGNSVISAGTYTNGGSVVLVKYDSSSGLAQWAQTVTAGPGDSLFTSVSAAASDGSVYTAGYIQGSGTYNFGNSLTATGTSSGGINMVLVKYNSSGVAQWAQTVTAGSTSSENLFGVSAASDGSVYAAGYVDGADTFNFGNGVTATGAYAGENVVLVKYDSTGAASWAQTVTAANNASFFAGVSVASGGFVYAAGDIEGTGTYNFGSGATATGTYIGSNVVLVAY